MPCKISSFRMTIGLRRYSRAAPDDFGIRAFRRFGNPDQVQ